MPLCSLLSVRHSCLTAVVKCAARLCDAARSLRQRCVVVILFGERGICYVTGAPAPGRRVCCRLGVCGACSLLGCAARVTGRVGAVNGWEVVFGVGVFACWVSRLGLLAVVGEAVLCILSSVVSLVVESVGAGCSRSRCLWCPSRVEPGCIFQVSSLSLRGSCILFWVSCGRSGSLGLWWGQSLW